MDEKLPTSESHQANPGYGIFQISKALETSESHPDESVREKALQKIQKWTQALAGMFSGQIHVGSRTPVDQTPAWVTLEVLTGGFASGNKLANGPLQEHELQLFQKLKREVSVQSSARSLLNSYYLSDEGLRVLNGFLANQTYKIKVPEEGALPVIAYMVANGYIKDARKLLGIISPFFESLRFYPIPQDHPAKLDSSVCVQNVGQMLIALRKRPEKEQILAQKQAVETWAPLYDRMVGLFLETLDSEPPCLKKNADGTRFKPAPGGHFPVEGGWPCRRFPEGWFDRAKALLAEIEKCMAMPRRCKRIEKRKSPFRQLRESLLACVADPKTLTGIQVGRIRVILACYIDKRGLPDSEDCRARRQKAQNDVSAPTFNEIGQVLIQRLMPLDPDEGLDEVGPFKQPVNVEESEKFHISSGTAIPEDFGCKLDRCIQGSVEYLVQKGVVSSPDMLAQLLPHMTMMHFAGGISDPLLNHLYRAVYQAFRNRRSLLLLNLEQQVKIDELPWINVLSRFRKRSFTDSMASRKALEDVFLLTMRSFPHRIFPNKLVTEFAALAKRAELKIPLVRELAADIFIGRFSVNFVNAAKLAAEVLGGTFYETYYGLDYSAVRKLPEPPKKIDISKPDIMERLCCKLAGVDRKDFDVAVNGMVIEQSQILTTHNLAAAFFLISDKEALKNEAFSLAQRCFDWICGQLQIKVRRWHEGLIVLKNTAYAWRQMIFFLSLIPENRLPEFHNHAMELLSQQPEVFRNRFAPAMLGLKRAIEGENPESPSLGSRRFLGWTKSEHWLMDKTHIKNKEAR